MSTEDKLEDRKITIEEKLSAELNRMNRELTTLRQLVTTAVHYMREAESEIPEKMRRFMNYMHDLHDIAYMYEEAGTEKPDYLKRDLERCHDRYRQLVKELNLEGGTFAKVRAEMAADPENRYDHTKLLYPPKPKETEECDKDEQLEMGLQDEKSSLKPTSFRRVP